jgi:hypothetical protein
MLAALVSEHEEDMTTQVEGADEARTEPTSPGLRQAITAIFPRPGQPARPTTLKVAEAPAPYARDAVAWTILERLACEKGLDPHTVRKAADLISAMLAAEPSEAAQIAIERMAEALNVPRIIVVMTIAEGYSAQLSLRN